MAVHRPSRRLDRRRLFSPTKRSRELVPPSLTTRDRELVSVLEVRIEPGDLNPRPLTPQSVTLPTLQRAATLPRALHYLYAISTHTLHKLYTNSTQTVHKLYTNSTQPLQKLYTISSLSPRSLYTIFPLSIHYLYTISTLPLNNLYTISTLSLHYLYIISTLSLHYLYTISALSIHYILSFQYSTHFTCTVYSELSLNFRHLLQWKNYVESQFLQSIYMRIRLQKKLNCFSIKAIYSANYKNSNFR